MAIWKSTRFFISKTELSERNALCMQNQNRPTKKAVTLVNGPSENVEGQLKDRDPRHVRNPHPAARFYFGDGTDYNADVNLERVKTPNTSRRLGTTSRNPSRRGLLDSVIGISDMGHIENSMTALRLSNKTNK